MTRNVPAAWSMAFLPGVIVSLILSTLAQPLRAAELPEPSKKSCPEVTACVQNTCAVAPPCDAVSFCVADQCPVDACAKDLCTAKACTQAECSLAATKCCTLAEKPCSPAVQVQVKQPGRRVVTRIERGVPMLSKIPYVSRLFKNIGIADVCPVGQDDVCDKQIAKSKTFYFSIKPERQAKAPCDPIYERSPKAIVPQRADSLRVDGPAVVQGELVLPGPVRRAPAPQAQWSPFPIQPLVGPLHSVAAPQTVTSVHKNKAHKSKAVYGADTANVPMPYPQPVAEVPWYAWPPTPGHPLSPVSMIQFEQFQLETLNAVYEARLEALQQQLEIMEELVELRVRNAQLEAQLKIAEHRQEMVRQLAKMHAEQARLRAQVEFASQREVKAAMPSCSQDTHPLKPRVTRKQDQPAGEKVH
jgi:hypothetical protein